MTRAVARTKIGAGGGAYLEVVIWPTIADTTAEWGGRRRRNKKGNDYYVYGFFRWSYRQKEINGKWQYNRKQKKIGTIHLSLTKIGAGLVAHELQHAVGAYSRLMGWQPEGERAAGLAGRLTRNFWNWYYKTFE